MKKTLAALASILLFAAVNAAPTGDALSVMNAFLATFAKDNPAWKTDVVAITDPNNVPPGRQLGYSAVLGYYTFLPKSWEQLTDAEKNLVYADARLKPFIVSLRNYNNYPSITGTDTPRPAFPVYPVDGFAPSPSYYPQQSPYTTPYYSPNQLRPATALVQPVTVVAPQPAQVSRLRVTPEEMLMDRPIKIYMQPR